MKRWVKVLSQYKLTDTERGVLAKGLNFMIAPELVTVKGIITVIEVAC